MTFLSSSETGPCSLLSDKELTERASLLLGIQAACVTFIMGLTHLLALKPRTMATSYQILFQGFDFVFLTPNICPYLPQQFVSWVQ